MEDLERYADYNEIDGDEPKKRHGAGKILGILLGLVILFVIGLLGYRLYQFGYYPERMKTLAFTDSLTAYYHETNGEIGAKTQKIRFPYDDRDIETQNKNDLGSFFFDHLILIPGIDELQVTARMNVSALDDVSARFGTEPLDPLDTSYFSFRLTDNYGRVYSAPVLVERDSYSVYRYFKIVFDGVKLTGNDDGLGDPEWIRIEILLDGFDTPYSYALIYENNGAYAVLKDYVPGKGEVAP